jgi:hypothetical protein
LESLHAEPAWTVGSAPDVSRPDGEPVDPDMTSLDCVRRDDRHLSDGGDVGQASTLTRRSRECQSKTPAAPSVIGRSEQFRKTNHSRRRRRRWLIRNGVSQGDRLPVKAR